ncbi:MAG: inorganic pyrophosphatase Ppa [Deltaproteobacteria bacterium]|nr:MAG: inorganic pyrophosphatase Ppa [Deltaproteobacteria bacterium]
MPTHFLQRAPRIEIQAYRPPPEIGSLRKTHVPFTGSPRKHPLDPEKVILIADPYSTQPFYYEFFAADIAYAEELPSIVNMDGETIPIARIWVKMHRVGIKCIPFRVEALHLDTPE